MASTEQTIQITIKDVRGEELSIDWELRWKVIDFKLLLHHYWHWHSPERQSLFFLKDGVQVLDNSKYLQDYNVQDGDVLHIFVISNESADEEADRIGKPLIFINGVMFRTVDGRSWIFKCIPGGTIARLKDWFQAQTSSVLAEQQDFIFSGKKLKDYRTVRSYGIEDGDLIFLRTMRASTSEKRDASSSLRDSVVEP